LQKGRYQAAWHDAVLIWYGSHIESSNHGNDGVNGGGGYKWKHSVSQQQHSNAGTQMRGSEVGFLAAAAKVVAFWQRQLK